jgi:hypothetical protein
MEHAGVIFADGTRQTTAYVAPTAVKGTWTNPNDNVWRVEEHTGGKAFQWNGTDAVKWWDPNEFATAANFRGGVVEYHAYTDAGTFIGQIMLASDTNTNNRTHSEVTSGDQEQGEMQFWYNGGDRTTLWFKGKSGSSKNIMVQWTARMFYGSEYWC